MGNFGIAALSSNQDRAVRNLVQVSLVIFAHFKISFQRFERTVILRGA